MVDTKPFRGLHRRSEWVLPNRGVRRLLLHSYSHSHRLLLTLRIQEFVIIVIVAVVVVVVAIAEAFHGENRSFSWELLQDEEGVMIHLSRTSFLTRQNIHIWA